MSEYLSLQYQTGVTSQDNLAKQLLWKKAHVYSMLNVIGSSRDKGDHITFIGERFILYINTA